MSMVMSMTELRQRGVGEAPAGFGGQADTPVHNDSPQDALSDGVWQPHYGRGEHKAPRREEPGHIPPGCLRSVLKSEREGGLRLADIWLARLI